MPNTALSLLLTGVHSDGSRNTKSKKTAHLSEEGHSNRIGSNSKAETSAAAASKDPFEVPIFPRQPHL